MNADDLLVNYLKNTQTLFRYYKSLGDKSLAQIDASKINWQPSEESNSIAIIVKHMAGNMLSRWTDFLHSDGEKNWRNREAEFENNIRTKDALLETWEKGWTCLFQAIDPLQLSDFEKLAYIRNEGHTITEAINRQLGHYAYHVGQLVYICRLIAGEEWESLSIPKGKSKAFNEEKFNKPKEKKNFI